MEFSVNTSIPILFEDLPDDTLDPRFTKVKIWLCHTGKNLNNSFFDKKIIEDAIPTLSNIPINGFIEVNSLNEADFKGHEQRLIIDSNGISIEYVGRAYGVIPENNNAQFEMKLCSDGVEREFLTVEGILWNKFKEAVDIVNRDGVKGQSMELEPSSVEGKFAKDGVFYFSKFMFEAACILGDNVTPAMTGSILEKFSKTSFTSQFEELLKEFNSAYSSFQQNAEDENIKVSNEGGFDVDEKLELFAQYTNLTDEDIAELKSNIDQFSLEEIQVKLEELSAAQKENFENKEEIDGKTEVNFSTTAQQLEVELRAAVSKERYTDQWGYDSRAYYYLDHDESRVYVEDNQDGYRPCGMHYVVNGDFVTIDFSTKKRIKWVPQDMVGEQDTTVSFISTERNAFEIEKIKTETTTEVSAQFSDAEKINNENIQLRTELSSLREYKANIDKQEKLDLINSFSELGEDNLKPLIEEVDNFSKDQLELQLFALKGKLGVFSAPEKEEKKDIKFGTFEFSTNKSSSPAWVNWVEQYKSKQ